MVGFQRIDIGYLFYFLTMKKSKIYMIAVIIQFDKRNLVVEHIKYARQLPEPPLSGFLLLNVL